MAAPVKECKVHFSPVQEGTGDPSPDNVRAISGWTGVEITRCGKNMLPAVTDSVTKSGVTYAVEKDSNSSITRIHVTGTSTGNSSINTIANDLILPPGNYILTAMTDGDGQHDFNLRKRGTSTDIVQRVSPKTFRISETTAYQSAYVYCKNGNTFDFYVHPMIRLSSIIDDTFEPYSGTTLSIDWTTEAGTVYGGYVDLVTGEVWAEWGYQVLNGTETWSTQPENATYNIKFLHNFGDALINAGVGYTDYIKRYQTNSELEKNGNLCCRFGWSDSLLYVMNATLGLDGVSDLASFKAYLSAHPLTAVYKLRQPTLITTLTPTQLKALRGANSIWSTANGNIELSYWTH